MNNAQMLAALSALPDADYMHANKLTDPLGTGTSYSAMTVVQMLLAAREDERRKCADACEDVAEECKNWEEDGEAGKVAAVQCAARIRGA